MKPLLTLLFVFNLVNDLCGQSVLDSVLYIEIDAEKNLIFRDARYPDPILYKEKGILVDIPETEYLIKECGDGWFQFRSQRREQAKTVSFRQLKKYSKFSSIEEVPRYHVSAVVRFSVCTTRSTKGIR